MDIATGKDQTGTQLAASIAALPPLPVTAQQILTCFGDEFIDAEKVSIVVENDPGICAKLLGLANSAYFGLAEPVNSIREAIARVLGVDTVRSLVLAMAIQQTFDNKKCQAFSAEQFWIRSMLTAECCKKISYADDSATDDIRDLAYSAGLCHNLGLMALAHMEPQRTHSVLTKHREAAQPNTLSGLFVNAIGTDHKILTAELARNWSLPEPMVSAYQFRALSDLQCDHRLGLVVSVAAAAVENAESDDDSQICLDGWAAAVGIVAADLQKMAVFSERQSDRIHSLASNMTR